MRTNPFYDAWLFLIGNTDEHQRRLPTARPCSLRSNQQTRSTTSLARWPNNAMINR
jgi:hypothetical protein